jgi:hypothetical protein
MSRALRAAATSGHAAAHTGPSGKTMTQPNARMPNERMSSRCKAGPAPASRAAAVYGEFNDMLGLWQICGQPDCRRRHRCSHDARACLRRHWAIVPEEEKEYWRGAFKAGKTTRSPEDMHRAGLAARDACLNGKTGMKAPAAARAEATSPPAETPAEPRVRIRTL